MLTKSSHYLFHVTAEIRDPSISTPLRKQRLTIQEHNGWREGRATFSLSSCNINPVNMTADELPFSTLQQQFSRLQNMENRQINFKLNGYPSMMLIQSG